MLKNSPFAFQKMAKSQLTASQQPLRACVAWKGLLWRTPARSAPLNTTQAVQSTQAQRGKQGWIYGSLPFLLLGTKAGVRCHDWGQPTISLVARNAFAISVGGSQRSALKAGMYLQLVQRLIVLKTNHRLPLVQPTGKPQFLFCLLCLMQDLVSLKKGWEFQ